MKMVRAKRIQHTDSIPNYYIYGDKNLNDDPDFIHIERIRTRSKLHNWEIQPHQHRNLFQVVYFTTGKVTAQIEEREFKIEGPLVMTVPPAVVHGFSFPARTDGFVLSIAEPLIFEEVEQGHEQSLELLLSKAFTIELNTTESQTNEINTILSNIDKEFHHPRLGRSMMLRCLLNMLLLLLRRQLDTDESRQGVDSTSASLYNRYRSLVEDHFRGHWPVSHYANLLGISERHLNRLCRRTVAKSALDVVHGRVLLEAKRQLIYTAAPVSSLAFELGFQDPAYFSRFFKKNTGTTPGQFRLEQLKSDKNDK